MSKDSGFSQPRIEDLRRIFVGQWRLLLERDRRHIPLTRGSLSRLAAVADQIAAAENVDQAA